MQIYILYTVREFNSCKDRERTWNDVRQRKTIDDRRFLALERSLQALNTRQDRREESSAATQNTAKQTSSRMRDLLSILSANLQELKTVGVEQFRDLRLV